MKNSRRFLSLATALLIMAGTFSACSSGNTAGGSNGAPPPPNRGDSGGNAGGAAYDGGYNNADNAGGDYFEYTPETNIMTEAAGIDDSYIAGEGVLQHADASTKTEVYEGYINSEEYNTIIEGGYKSTVTEPLSTFSIDVDTASYANVRRMIEQGMNVDPNAVRIEEFINYFSYDYSKPTTDDPFSVNTELSDCPWNEEAKLLLVGLKAEEIKQEERPPLNLVFLIDVSGSMFSRDKLPLVQESFTMLTDTLNENDRISIVTYAGEDKVVLEGTSGQDKERIKDAINSLEAGGSTYGEAGINRAYELAEEYFIKNGNNRVILATDGDLNVGLSSEEELTALIEEKRESGVFLSVLGFGSGNLKDDRMEALADHGNGNYSYIDSKLEAEKVLINEMTGTLYTVAKDVKIQVEFNPANVSAYRLIGYENRALANEDFDDDTKDAGEIGAGHTVTALYEILLTNGHGPEIPETDLKYSSVNYSYNESDELLTISLRYKQPDSDISKKLAVPVTMDIYRRTMPENMRFAAAAAEFGMVLRDSEFRGTSSCEQILDILEGKDYRDDEYKTEFLYLVKTMRKRGY